MRDTERRPAETKSEGMPGEYTVNPFLDHTIGMERHGAGSIVNLRLRPGHAADEVPGKWRTRRLVHAAVLSTLGQEAAWKALSNGNAITISMVTQFLYAAFIDAGDLRASGRILREGRSISVAQGDVYQDSETVASVTVVFRIRNHK